MPGASVPSSVIPPKKKPEILGTSVRIPVDLVEEIDRAAKEEGYSRNETIVFLLRGGLTKHYAEKEKREPKRG